MYIPTTNNEASLTKHYYELLRFLFWRDEELTDLNMKIAKSVPYARV